MRSKRGAWRRLVMTSIVAGSLAVVVVAGVSALPATPARKVSIVVSPTAQSTGKPHPSLYEGMGCAPKPTLKSLTTGRDFLCGSSHKDTIVAGPSDVVRGRGGNDTIHAKNNSPNNIDGGAGKKDTLADVDQGLDTAVKNVEQGYNRARELDASHALPPACPEAHTRDPEAWVMVDTPVCFPLKRPTIKCNVSNAGKPTITVTAPPQLAANNANPGLVDWQVVAWTMLIFKWDTDAQQWQVVRQTPWYWDEPYDVFDGHAKDLPENAWRLFGRHDDRVENVASDVWTLQGNGYFTADFKDYWYRASNGPHQKPVPSGAWTWRNFDATGKNAVTQSQPYCRFPASLPPLVVPALVHDFADVTGDSAADSIRLSDRAVSVRKAASDVFDRPRDWSDGPFRGFLGTYFADVTGDRKADAVAVNRDTVLVSPSSGTQFGSPRDWTHGPYFGSKGTYFADVTGDGKADAIVVNDNTVLVRPSTGTAFSPNQDWTQGPYFGSKGTYFADVTGDGKADAIVVNDNTVLVRPSTGTAFSPNQDWTMARTPAPKAPTSPTSRATARPTRSSSTTTPCSSARAPAPPSHPTRTGPRAHTPGPRAPTSPTSRATARPTRLQ